jgi:hypothetical protein
MPSRFDDVVITGNLLVGSMNVPIGSVSNAQVAAAAGIDASKLMHKHPITYSQNHGTAVAAQRRVVYVADAAGNLDSVVAGVSVAAIGDSTMTVKVKKNGVDFLASSIVLDNGDAAFASVAGAFSSSGAYVAGDVIEVDVTVSAGTGTLGQGLFVQIFAIEAP